MTEENEVSPSGSTDRKGFFGCIGFSWRKRRAKRRSSALAQDKRFAAEDGAISRAAVRAYVRRILPFASRQTGAESVFSFLRTGYKAKIIR